MNKIPGSQLTTPSSSGEPALTFRFLAEPEHVNFGGKVHGGMVMKWIDHVAYTCAVNWSGSYSVTVYVGGIRFFHPIEIGNIVELRAQIIYTGNTSMHIAVDVYTRNPAEKKHLKTTHCVIVFVAVDASNHPIPVPKWIPQTDRDKELERYALRLAEARKNVEAEMQPFLQDEE